jgi:hypothetical protein
MRLVPTNVAKLSSRVPLFVSSRRESVHRFSEPIATNQFTVDPLKRISRWHNASFLDQGENEKKGGEKDEKERITRVQPVAVFHTVLGQGYGAGAGLELRSNSKGSG